MLGQLADVMADSNAELATLLYRIAGYNGDASSIYNLGVLALYENRFPDAEQLFRITTTCFGRLLWEDEDEYFFIDDDNSAALAKVCMGKMCIFTPGGRIAEGIELLKSQSAELAAVYQLGLAYMYVESLKDVDKAITCFEHAKGFSDAAVLLMEYYKDLDQKKACEYASRFVTHCHKDDWIVDLGLFVHRLVEATTYLKDNNHASGVEKGRQKLLDLPGHYLVQVANLLLRENKFDEAATALECAGERGSKEAYINLGHIWYNCDSKAAQQVESGAALLEAARFYKLGGDNKAEAEAEAKARGGKKIFFI